MKKIFYLAVAVLGIASTASCNKAQFEEKELKGSAEKLMVVGSIAGEPGTKVSFTDNGTAIHPDWEVGDQIFGFSDAGNVTYSVESLSAEGKAHFTLVSGTEPGEGQTAYMIYAPGKSVSDLSSNQLAVDLSAQDGTLAGIKDHVIMCATATVAESKLQLSFTNQVAILGVEQFTGLKENTTYTSATFTTAGPTGTVKVDGGVLKLVTDASYGTITATGTFASDASGNTTSPIYFAVPPTTAVSHTFCLHSSMDHRAGCLTQKAVASGNYLYMDSKVMSQVAVYEDFEDGTVGSLPSGFIIDAYGTGNANQRIIDTEKKNGNKSFQLQGKSGLAGEGHFNFNSDLFSHDGDVLVLEAYYYQVEINDSYCGSIGLGFFGTQLIQQIKLYAGTNGDPYVLSDTYERQKWHHIRMVANKTAYTYQMYIDGILMEGTRGVETTTDFPIRTDIASRANPQIEISAGHGGTTYFDDILLFKK